MNTRYSTVAALESVPAPHLAVAALRSAADYLLEGGRNDFAAVDALNELAEVLQDEVDGITFWVGVYLEDRAFGGHEEGGWWFDYGELQTARWVYQECGLYPGCFPTRAAARAAVEQFAAGLDRLNDERRSDIGSVLSEGRFVALIFENELPKHYPEQRPRYE